MLITNFAAGELSTTLNGRVDLRQYYSGVSRLENFDVIPTGGIERRTGTKRLLKLDANCRIIPFIVNSNYIFILAIAPGNIKVYQIETDLNGHVVATYKKNIANIYGSLRVIQQIQYAQTYDQIILVHKDYRPMQIKFEVNTVNAYTLTFDFYPNCVVSDPDNQIMLVKEGTSAPTASRASDGSLEFIYTNLNNVTTQKKYTVGASGYYLQQGKLFKYPYSGSAWEQTSTDSVDTTLFNTTEYPGAVSFFNNRLIFASTNNHQQKLWASMAPDTVENRYTKFSTYKKYVTVNKVIKEADLHTFTANLAVADIDTDTGTTTLRGVSQSLSSITDISKYYIQNDLIPIGTKVVSINSALGTMIINTANISIEADLTNLVFNISLWKDPSTVTAEDYEYSVAEQNVTTADCSYNFELASEENDAVKFLASGRYLSIATESSIWAMAAGSTAVNIQVENQGRFGSDEIQGLSIAQATVYFAQGKKGIREFYYDNAAQAFQTNNIAIHSQQMLQESAAVDFDYSCNPYNKLIITRNDGKAVNLLYDKNNGVMAWGRITRTEGVYNSCAVTRGFDEKDFIFFVVEQPVIGGDSEYYLEMLGGPDNVYIDSWEEYTGENVGYNGNAILWNATTKQKCCYSNIPEDFINTGDVVYIGYTYISYIKSMPVIANDPNGRKRITNLLIRFLDSYKPILKITGLPDEHFVNISEPYSGVANITYPGQTDRDVYFELEAEEPNPVNILAVNAILA